MLSYFLNGFSAPIYRSLVTDFLMSLSICHEGQGVRREGGEWKRHKNVRAFVAFFRPFVLLCFPFVLCCRPFVLFFVVLLYFCVVSSDHTFVSSFRTSVSSFCTFVVLSYFSVVLLCIFLSSFQLNLLPVFLKDDNKYD